MESCRSISWSRLVVKIQPQPMALNCCLDSFSKVVHEHSGDPHVSQVNAQNTSLWMTKNPLKWKKSQRRWASTMCPWSSGYNAECDWPLLLQRSWLLSTQRGPQGGFCFSCQWLSGSAGGVKYFSLCSLKECEYLPELDRPAWGKWIQGLAQHKD